MDIFMRRYRSARMAQNSRQRRRRFAQERHSLAADGDEASGRVVFDQSRDTRVFPNRQPRAARAPHLEDLEIGTWLARNPLEHLPCKRDGGVGHRFLALEYDDSTARSASGDDVVLAAAPGKAPGGTLTTLALLLRRHCASG